MSFTYRIKAQEMYPEGKRYDAKFTVLRENVKTISKRRRGRCSPKREGRPGLVTTDDTSDDASSKLLTRNAKVLVVSRSEVQPGVYKTSIVKVRGPSKRRHLRGGRHADNSVGTWSSLNSRSGAVAVRDCGILSPSETIRAMRGVRSFPADQEGEAGVRFATWLGKGGSDGAQK